MGILRWMEPVFSAESIAHRVRELGAAIRAEHGDKDLVLLGILKGAAVFLADLAREVGEPLDLSFVHARSYGNETRSRGEVRIGSVEEEALRDKTVVIVDTILDTGRTLQEVIERVKTAGAADIVTCVLFDKPSRREVSITPDLVGFTAPARFLVGYGLDHAGRYRALRYVGALDG